MSCLSFAIAPLCIPIFVESEACEALKISKYFRILNGLFLNGSADEVQYPEIGTMLHLEELEGQKVKSY